MRLGLPPTLRRPLVAAVLAVLLGGAAVSHSLDRRMRAEDERQRAEAAWRSAEAERQRLPERIAQVQRSQPLYADLRQRGFVGEEQRLDWISALARIQGGMKLDSLFWHLEPRRVSELPGLYASTMQLRLAPADPDVLRALLERLDDEANGRFSADTCTYTPSERQGQVECSLTWWTWDGPKGAP